MKNDSRTRRYIKYLCCMMAVIMGLIQPCMAMAVEMGQKAAQEGQTSVQDTISENGSGDIAGEVQYITGFEALAEEDAYFPCMYKPSLEELLSVFPETIWIWTEGAEAPSELEVTWECKEDFDATQFESYTFYPKWDDTMYGVADTAADSVVLPSITVEVPASNDIISDLKGAKSALQGISGKKTILALVYLCDKYEVKQSPSDGGTAVCTVTSGQSVQITDVELDEYGAVWYQVLLYRNAKEYVGYIEKEYLATSDEEFIDWENAYLDFSSIPMVMAASAGYPDVDQFPASYQNALYALKDKHPNWIFVRMDTGVDWNTAIANEKGDKSLIHSSSSGSWQNGVYGQGWSYASEGILKYYMDPRNFLNDSSIFQFEQLTYNESYHTTTAVQEVIKSSFMASAIPGDSRTYAQAFTEIGQRLNISPFHLASRVLQEQGTKGTSPIISGTYAGYEGYYNYFNVSAAGKTNLEEIVNGLKKAVAMGWDTRYKSLNGGAAVIGENYIMKGQDTLYLQKFNVSNGKYANYTHQYMQNIQAPSSEASNVRRAYSNAGALENSFTFKIPVYLNMPASACSKPEITDSITFDKTTVSSLEVDKTVTLVPYVNGSKVDYVSDMTFTSSNTSVATVDSKGKVTAVSPGTATISCTRSGANTATCTVTVIKTNPNVKTPVLSPGTYRDGLKLSDFALPDGWTWVKGDTLIEAGTFSYPASYTPADTTRYNAITRNIEFTVTKAVPVCKMPEGFEVKAGTVLGEITLPNGFAWESSVETKLEEPGEHTFYVSYDPDEKNYYKVEHLPIIVRVTGKASTDEEQDDNGIGGSTTTGGNTSGGGSTATGGNTSGGSTATGGNTTGGNVSTNGGISAGEITDSNTTNSGNVPSNGNASSSNTTGNGSTSSNSTSNSNTSNSNTSNNSTTSGGSTSAGGGVDVGSAGSTATTTIPGNNNNAPTNSNQTGGNTTTTTPPANDTSNSGQTGGATTTDSPASETDGNTEPAFRPSVTIKMDDTTILTVEKLQMAKEQNLNLVLDMGNYATWSIDAESVDLSVVTEADMGIMFGTTNVPTERIAEILNGNKYIEFTLAHSGAYGFHPVMSMTFDSANSGRYANLFRYQLEEDTLEYICSSIIDANGGTSFRIEQGGSYIAIVSDEPMSDAAAEASDDHSADSRLMSGAGVGAAAGIVIVVMGCGIFMNKRIKRRKYEKPEDEETDEIEEDEETDEIEEDEREDKENEENREKEEVNRKKKAKKKKHIKTAPKPGMSTTESDAAVEAAEVTVQEQATEENGEESDWIEDEDWNEPDMPEQKQPESPDKHDIENEHPAADDWIDDDEWDTANDWVDDEEWEKMNEHK
ncbi:MAG: Ig-like domain-containing protein [Lachnospiraceae bacterium]|nr:Ig-like domain-containing protein [Lachnospiraceae bacterium]